MKTINNIMNYLKKLIDSTDYTSMSRFLALNVTMSTLIAWIINSAWLGYMVAIPQSILEFNFIVLGYRAVGRIGEVVEFFSKRGGDKDAC